MTNNAPATPPQPADDAGAPPVVAPEVTAPEVTLPEPPRAEPADVRPRPAYGEYAPEGWVSPVQSAATQGSASTAGNAAPSAPTSPTLHGVPHNLGVSGSSGTQPTPAAGPETPATAQYLPPAGTDQAQQTGAPSAPQYQPPHQYQQHQQQQQLQHSATQMSGPAAQSPKPSSNRADRIVSIILLVLGALGALNLAYSAMNLGSQLRLMAQSAGLESVNLPASFATLQSVGAIIMLSIYAVVVLWSIARLRARKITFWLPLAGGLLAFVAFFVLTFIALTMVPELSTAITPETLERILSQLGSVQ